MAGDPTSTGARTQRGGRLRWRRRRRRRLAGAAVAATVAMIAAGCGTRLPPSAFSAGALHGSGAAAGATSTRAGAPTAGTSAGAGATAGTPAGAAGTAAATGGVGTGAGRGSAPGGGGGGSRSPGGTAGTTLGATDVGVTATTITVGNITSKENPFGPAQFIPNFIGAQAYFDALNASGGIDGRQVRFIMCDDQGDPNLNQQCAQTLIAQDKVFALVANNIYQYAAAPYVNAAKVPDVGGEPIDPAYFKYPYLFDIFGEPYPRNGTQYGQGGNLYGTSELWQFFRQHYGVHTIGVVYYDESASQLGAQYISLGAKNVGDSVVMEPVNLALPDFSGAVNDMRAKGVQAVFDALDESGNARLCQAMEDQNFIPVAKVQTSSTWNNAIDSTFANSPRCRNIIFASAPDASYNSLSNPAVAAFRQAMARYESQAMPTGQLAIWAEEGYAGAEWFTQAARSCGRDLTRACVVNYLNTSRNFTAQGLLAPRDFQKLTLSPSQTAYSCVEVVQWQDSAGGWVTRGSINGSGCYTTHWYAYPAT